MMVSRGANRPENRGFVVRGGRQRAARRGAAVVEFAIVLPLFLLMVFGMVEYGRMVMAQQIITNAAREGARRGVIDGATTAEVTTLVNGYLTDASIGTATVSITPDPTTVTNGGPITVTVSVPYSQVSWIPSPMYLGSKTLTASVVMRCETTK